MKETSKKIILKKNKKIDKIWHPETKLVFKSKEDKVVIGIFDTSSESIKPIDDDCIAMCDEWGFKVDRMLLQEDAVPDEDNAVPDEDNAVPDEDNAVPDEDNAVPDEDNAVPDEDNDVPDEEQIDELDTPLDQFKKNINISLLHLVNSYEDTIRQLKDENKSLSDNLVTTQAKLEGIKRLFN